MKNPDTFSNPFSNVQPISYSTPMLGGAALGADVLDNKEPSTACAKCALLFQFIKRFHEKSFGKIIILYLKKNRPFTRFFNIDEVEAVIMPTSHCKQTSLITTTPRVGTTTVCSCCVSSRAIVLLRVSMIQLSRLVVSQNHQNCTNSSLRMFPCWGAFH